MTSVLLIQSVESHRHWHGVAAGTSVLQEIREALEKTNLDGLWGKNIGLLYFVVLVFHTAAFGTSEYLFGHVLQGRIHFEVTYSYNDWHGALQPMAVLSDLVPNEKLQLTENHGGLELMAGYSVTLADMQTSIVSTSPISPPSFESVD